MDTGSPASFANFAANKAEDGGKAQEYLFSILDESSHGESHIAVR